jgi:TetR/AcrR family transcriptional repressor of lmrAB and yxaGH operons
MVSSAAARIQRRGLSRTADSEVVADSGAPRGSIYHHFPEGKDQLAADAMAWTLEWVLARQRACRARTPLGVLECFIDIWRQTVIDSGATAGCVVAGVAIDTMPDAAELMARVRTAFADWVSFLADQLLSVGLPKKRALPVATAALAAMEGAIILCRAERSVEPLETVATELKRLVASAVG